MSQSNNGNKNGSVSTINDSIKTTPKVLLAAQQLGVKIAGKTICQDLDLELKAGEIWGILGGNGAGKTTLLHTLAGFREPDHGQVLIEQTPIKQIKAKHRAQKLGFLLQDEKNAFPATVLETALQGRHPHLGHWQWESVEDEKIALQALEQVGLTDYAERTLDRLSGGERQRLKIATLLVQDPKIWLLDEPANHLDLHHQISLLTLLKEQTKQQQGCLLMSLHDLNLAWRFCDKLIFLYPDDSTREHKVEQGDKASLLQAEKLQHLYQHPIHCLDTAQGKVFIAG